LKCRQCGGRLCGSASTGGSGIKHHYYHCKYPCKERVKAPLANDAFSDYIATFQFKAGVNDIYDHILDSLFKSKVGEKNANKQALQVEIEKNKERMNKAQQMMLDGEMEMGDYKEIKRNLEPKIEAMLAQQLNFNQIEVEYRGYLKKGLTAIKNLGHLFDNAEINGKQDIIRSTLKENGVFSEGKVRTEKLNNLILLTTYGDGQCGENKKRKGSKICSLSGIVPYGLDLSNLIDDFQALRILMSSRTWKDLL